MGTRPRFAPALSPALLITAILLQGCAESKPTAGSESHFLSQCTQASECGPELGCHAGVCTRPCAETAQCADLSKDASCPEASRGEQSFCALDCARASDCASVDAALLCLDSLCRWPGQGLDTTMSPDGGKIPDGREQDNPLAPVGYGPREGANLSGTHDGPVQMAFLAGFGPEEEVFLRSEAGELIQVSVWPPSDAQANCETPISSGGYIEGWGRFGSVTFDHSGDYLLMRESIQCGNNGTILVARDMRTGGAATVAEFKGQVSVLSNSQVSVALAYDWSEPMDPQAPVSVYAWSDGTLTPIMPPSTPTPEDDAIVQLTTGPQLLTFADHSELLISGRRALAHRGGTWTHEGGWGVLSRLELGTVTVSPSGTRLCALATPRGSSSPLIAVGRRPDGDWYTQELAPTLASGSSDRQCAFSDNERHVMFRDQLLSLDENGSVTSVSQWDGFKLAGSYGGLFYGLTDAGFEQRDPESGASVVLVTQQEIRALCPNGSEVEARATFVLSPPDERPVALIKHSCGCIDCDISGSMAVRLDSGAHEVIELGVNSHQVYGLAWPTAGGAVLLSTQGTQAAQPAAGSFFSLDALGAMQVQILGDITTTLHAPSVPPRARIAASAPADCTPEGVAAFLLAGSDAIDCGYFPAGQDPADGLTCAREATTRPFQLLWDTAGTDSRLTQGVIRTQRSEQAAFYYLDYDMFGWEGGATLTYSACSAFDGRSCQTPTAPTCRCIPHDNSGQGVALHCEGK